MRNITHPEDDRIDQGVALLEGLDFDRLSLPEVMDRIEIISEDPAVIREILRQAELKGVIDRNGAVVRFPSGSLGRFEEEKVVTREGKFSCERCGQALTTGHFLKSGVTEVGPFGPECIRYVVGWE